MTIDKFNHYLGAQLVSFICSLNADQLQNMKRNLINDMPFHTSGSNTLFLRNIELNLINSRL